ncbi:hypothetical protein D3C87_1367930 [compost metagenome]
MGAADACDLNAVADLTQVFLQEQHALCRGGLLTSCRPICRGRRCLECGPDLLEQIVPLSFSLLACGCSWSDRNIDIFHLCSAFFFVGKALKIADQNLTYNRIRNRPWP